MTTKEKHETIEEHINMLTDGVNKTIAEIGPDFYEGKRRLIRIQSALSALSTNQTVSRFKQEVRKDNPFAEIGTQQEGDAVNWDGLQDDGELGQDGDTDGELNEDDTIIDGLPEPQAEPQPEQQAKPAKKK